MRWIATFLASVAFASAAASAANATIIAGSFSGTVDPHIGFYGSFNGVSGSSINGESVTGTFSFDTDNTPQSYSNSTYGYYHGASALSITATIGSNVFTSDTVNSSSIWLGADTWTSHGDNYVQLDTYGSTVFEMGLYVDNPGLYADPNDLTTLSFDLTHAVSAGLYLQDNLYGTQWSIELDSISASIAQAPTDTPAPAALALLGIGLVGLGVTRQKLRTP